MAAMLSRAQSSQLRPGFPSHPVLWLPVRENCGSVAVGPPRVGGGEWQACTLEWREPQTLPLRGREPSDSFVSVFVLELSPLLIPFCGCAPDTLSPPS